MRRRVVQYADERGGEQQLKQDHREQHDDQAT
jgi:hypothetical protein